MSVSCHARATVFSGQLADGPLLNGLGQRALPGIGGVQIDERGRLLEWPMRSISSRRVAPASATRWLPAWRRSWKWMPVRPVAVIAGTQEVCDGRLRQTLESGVGAESASSHERSPGSS
jgi:hypothetical protein